MERPRRKAKLQDRLFRRELGDRSGYSTTKGIFGDRKWIKDLDIVNELSGHSGCVNALSWSKSGQLLASGSDDTRLNIHSFQPDHSPSPFQLSTSISTGHTANVFSVKFMPHSNDRTLISAAGDADIRVYDLEYAGSTSSGATQGLRLLSEADAGTKVYRSHSDRVKRIVTESSPNLFLSCSEDGEVRQWDIRQPSSAYPRPRGAAGFGREGGGEVPPPLISYKRHRLDLNTISCSPSQPHYIALGGAHLHCFLHDRRMLGRDKLEERGVRSSSIQSSRSGYSDAYNDDMMSEATQCVRRFAPEGQRRMKSNDTGHITACKISDANPNEMIASWSGDWIYSFDLIRDADAREHRRAHHENFREGQQRRAKQSQDRKRKRVAAGSTQSLEGTARAESKPRASAAAEPQSLRVNYENGQSEDIPLIEEEESPSAVHSESRTGPVSHLETFRLASRSVQIRKHMFALGDARPITEQDPTGHATSFTSAFGHARSTLEIMDGIMRDWRYPVNPDELEVAFQMTLRKDRQRGRRFIQASGTIARLLGATAVTDRDEMLDRFAEIEPAPNETVIDDKSEQFHYDFIKAIILWLTSGPTALVEGFRELKAQRNSSRFPIPEGAGIEAIDEILIPYLLRDAGSKPILKVDSSRFEHDASRTIFNTDSAVVAFANALKIPFEDLSQAVISASPDNDSSSDVSARYKAQDRKAALRFWGFEVARGLLLNAGEGVTHVFVDRAFGGLGKSDSTSRQEEKALQDQLGNIDPEEEDPAATSVALTSRPAPQSDRESSERRRPATPPNIPTIHIDAPLYPSVEDADSDEEMIPLDDVRATMTNARATNGGDDDLNEDDDDNDDNDEDDYSDADSEETSSTVSNDEPEEPTTADPNRILFRPNAAFDRSSLRSKVQTHTPCFPAQRLYRGAANTRTVKDVNFFGLNDEYVVSGSDSGHLFIWDRQSTQLLNILEGDGEVVNVVQGHPYEPMIAASGIDHTVKIFSPDARARQQARQGIGISGVDASAWSSLQFGGRRPRRPIPRRTQQQDEEDAEALRQQRRDAETTSEPAFQFWQDEDVEYGDDDFEGPNGLPSKRRTQDEYKITSQNEVDRRGGNREAFITRGMLAQLAAQIRLRRAQRGAGEAGEGEEGEGDGDVRIEGGNVVLGEDCTVM
ncbi:MAG: hypothetical protein M1828_001005 [Chrysothrix sp. TS-e1954]|nr:MAG: hypothetical protein M1828_001005 [Chrysothrix sp. TS-e1954]